MTLEEAMFTAFIAGKKKQYCIYKIEGKFIIRDILIDEEPIRQGNYVDFADNLEDARNQIPKGFDVCIPRFECDLESIVEVWI